MKKTLIGLRFLVPPFCRDRVTRYVVTGLLFLYLVVVVVVVVVVGGGDCSSW